MTLPIIDSTEYAGGFDACVIADQGAPLHACAIDTVQVNIGLTCDLACRHCHVSSSPKRTEQMDWPTMELVLAAARRAGAQTIDITGGAPEMNPHFRSLIDHAVRLPVDVMVRTNLTILLEDGYRDYPEYYRERGVHLVASLPCYLEPNVDRQRGLKVYERSIEVIQQLNAVGYGIDESLPLDLIYNPTGPSLPPDQHQLERDYRRELDQRFGIRFSRLYTITNMPIGRFLHDLQREGRSENYQQLLRESFNPHTVDGLMCRRQIHVSWDGTLHDCDFNYALGMPVMDGSRRHIRDFDPKSMINRRIATGAHCFGCTAGHGSSCGGAIVDD